MLPSKGFFKKITCPFFEKGLCVRPHCHFRHRKKVLNDHSPSRETEKTEEEEVDEEDEEAAEALLKLIAENKELYDGDKISSSSTSEVNETKGEDDHDTLFAKLVNQTNTYEKINRHIPCAYTPTPQSKSAEPKCKSVSAVTGFADSEKSLELITKARTLLQNYCAENIKKKENKYSKGDEKNDGQTIDKNSHEEQCSLKEESDFSPDESNKSKNLDKVYESNGGPSSQYVPSKETSSESLKYVPECSESDTGKEYVPSREKTEDNEYVPESPTGLDGLSGYGGRDEEGSNSEDKMEEKEEAELSKLDFLSSEIEMMKKLLNEESNQSESLKGSRKSEESGNHADKSSKSQNRESSHSEHHHKSSSKDKSRSSSSHSSSRSRHSSSHSSSSRHSRSSSSSSRRHSSSRHHSSGSSRRSSEHRSSSRRHSRGEESRRDRRQRDEDRKNKSRKTDAEENCLKAKSKVQSSEEDEEEDDGGRMDVNASASDSEGAEQDGGTRSRKRKLSEDADSLKYISLSNEEDFDDDPDTVEKQCLEIFNSYTNASESKRSKVQEIVVPNAAEYESVVQSKKRTAHSSVTMADHSVLRHKVAKKSNLVKSAQELMYERYKICEKQQQQQQQQQQSPQSNSTPITGLNRPSIRIAAVSNIQQMLMAKKAIQEKINQGLKVNERTTIAHTVAPGGSRVAHVPKVIPDVKEKPTITEGSKQVPRVKRQTYLDKLLTETNQIYPTKTESAEEAVKLESEIFRLHSGSLAAYHAAFVSLLLKTRRRVASVKGETSTSAPSKPKLSHFDVLSGGKKNFSVIKTKRVELSMLSDKQIYDELLKCKLTPEELKENGFPVRSDRPGYATCSLNFELKYNEKYQYIKKTKGNRRYCIRCSKQYDIDPRTLKQLQEGPETCSYHPGKKKSGGRNCERIYNCCNSSSTEGCATHVRHVTDCNDYENYPNCVRTLAKDDEDNPGVYALDCEMVYTRLGSELARVTVVNLKKEIVYDTLVKPKHEIECYNTFYSGIEEKMMEGVETTLKDVQAVLLSMFSDKTILIGHSLDSDLRALHLIHDTVVDTSVVYKNEKYYPYKYSLKDLCAKKISKIIQDNINGHDSSEDAIAALEIMLQHVKEEIARYDSIESYEADRGR